METSVPFKTKIAILCTLTAILLVRTDSCQRLRVMTIILPVAPFLKTNASPIRALELPNVAPLLVSRAVHLVRHIPTIILVITKPVLMYTRRSVRTIHQINIVEVQTTVAPL